MLCISFWQDEQHLYLLFCHVIFLSNMHLLGWKSFKHLLHEMGEVTICPHSLQGNVTDDWDRVLLLTEGSFMSNALIENKYQRTTEITIQLIAIKSLHKKIHCPLRGKGAKTAPRTTDLARHHTRTTLYWEAHISFTSAITITAVGPTPATWEVYLLIFSIFTSQSKYDSYAVSMVTVETQ